MDVSLVLLCDSANVTADGKLNILGQFDVITASGFPALHPQMHLVLRLSVARGGAGGERSLMVRLVNADDNPIGEVDGLLSVPPRPASGEALMLQTIVPLPNVTFPEPGEYALDILIDGERKRRLELRVNYDGKSKETKRGS